MLKKYKTVYVSPYNGMMHILWTLYRTSLPVYGQQRITETNGSDIKSIVHPIDSDKAICSTAPH